VLTMVLGPLLETNIRRALSITNGDYLALMDSPISKVLIVGAVLMIALAFGRSLSRTRHVAMEEE